MIRWAQIPALALKNAGRVIDEMEDGMTPDAWIEKILSEPDHIPLGVVPNGLLNRVSEAIAAAVAEEREACAKVAESHVKLRPLDCGSHDDVGWARGQIAAAIRARGSEDDG